ncbi:MAG: trypsin-like serine protease [Kiritimatiellia bacterium]
MPTLSHAILAGGEFDEPADYPSNRLDPQTADSPFNAVGALRIDTGSSTYSGTAIALSRHWVLSAAHNADFNDDGQPDPGLGFTLHLPGHGSMSTSTAHIHPDFTGFGNPSIHNDLSLLHFTDPLPELNFPSLGLSFSTGQELTLVGYGRSGFGSYGYTTSASTDDRRIGWNTVETMQSSSSTGGQLFRYTFHDPSDTQSLGNDRETIIGPGDSGGPALIDWGGGQALVGINTFTEGYGGRFGDVGGGVALDPAWAWISETTGLALIPEPGTLVLLLVAGFWLAFKTKKFGFTPQK